MQTITNTLELLRASPGGPAPSAAAEKLGRAEELRCANGGQANAEIALLLAEAESALLQMPHPDRAVLQDLAKLRMDAAEEI